MINRIKRFFNRLSYLNSEASSKLEEQIRQRRIAQESNSHFHGNNHLKNYSVGKNSYISFNSIIYNCDIGNYCSIGPNVVIGFGDHPYKLISTSPFVYLNSSIVGENTIDEILPEHFKKVTIRNDVWIGANVYIKNGVTVGNGAIVGAGSVVVKDVGDYEIVGGVPAKIIKKRFSEDIIEHLLKIRWWNFDLEELNNYRDIILNPSLENLLRMEQNINNGR